MDVKGRAVRLDPFPCRRVFRYNEDKTLAKYSKWLQKASSKNYFAYLSEIFLRMWWMRKKFFIYLGSIGQKTNKNIL